MLYENYNLTLNNYSYLVIECQNNMRIWNKTMLLNKQKIKSNLVLVLGFIK